MKNSDCIPLRMNCLKMQIVGGCVCLLLAWLNSNSVFAADFTFDDNHYLSIKSGQHRKIFGNDVRILFRAYTEPFQLFESAAVELNMRDYLVTVRLGTDVAASRRVIGPLWKSEDPISRMAADGLAFTEKDRDDVVKMPRFLSDSSGNLIKRQMLKGKPDFQEWQLQVGKSDASWQTITRPEAIDPDVYGERSKSIRALTKAFLLQYEPDGTQSLVDLICLEKRRKGWLDRAFNDLENWPALEPYDCALTDDLKYLVVRPKSMHWVGPEDDRKQVEVRTFMFGSKEYLREGSPADWGAGHFLVYTADNKLPRIYGDLIKQRVFGGLLPVSIDSELRFVHIDSKAVSLIDVEKRVTASLALTEKLQWVADATTRVELTDKRISFSLTPSSIRDNSDEVRVLIWYFRDAKTSEHSFAIKDLFKLGKQGFEPINPIPVSEEKPAVLKK